MNSLLAFKSVVAVTLVRLIGASFLLGNYVIALGLAWRVGELLGLAGGSRWGLMAGCAALLLPVAVLQAMFVWFSVDRNHIKKSIAHLDETTAKRGKK